MNQRPTRAPAPPQETYVDDRPHNDASFQEVERPNSLPATRAQATEETPPEQPVARPRAEFPATGFAHLAGAIAGVMAELKPVEKAGWNDFHKYEYARMQDLSAALTPLMGKHGIVVFQNELSRDMFDEGRAMAVRYEFTIVHKSGEIWPERPIITGVSMCRTSNGKYDDKAFNKCHTSARKYFLLSLFQIPTEDGDDADSDGGSGNKPRPRRAPAPDGKAAPQVIPINNGEQPAAWAARFTKAIESAATIEAVNQWYDANFSIFEKIKKAGDTATYGALIDAMDARERALLGTAAPAKPEQDGGFPGDKKPPARQRRATAPKEGDPISSGPERIDEEEWITAISNAYSACEDVTSLAEAQTKHMIPYKDRVSEAAWSRAVDVTKAEVKRIGTND